MKFERQIGLVLVSVVFPYICAVAALVFYLQEHPGPVPRWIPAAMLCLLVLTIFGGAVIVHQVGKKKAQTETGQEREVRQARAIKGMRAGLVLYVLILLNGIRLIAEHSIPFAFAIPGLLIDVLLILVFWTSLRRLKRARAAGEPSARNCTSPQ